MDWWFLTLIVVWYIGAAIVIRVVNFRSKQIPEEALVMWLLSPMLVVLIIGGSIVLYPLAIMAHWLSGRDR